jgi:hypothetical protein
MPIEMLTLAELYRLSATLRRAYAMALTRINADGLDPALAPERRAVAQELRIRLGEVESLRRHREYVLAVSS